MGALDSDLEVPLDDPSLLSRVGSLVWQQIEAPCFHFFKQALPVMQVLFLMPVLLEGHPEETK